MAKKKPNTNEELQSPDEMTDSAADAAATEDAKAGSALKSKPKKV